jgi:Ca2+-binding EF-hand superfamily protein
LLVSNERLLELDLSSNLLGSSESLSLVDPNTRTGGEALAEYIKSSKCRLQILKLAWNNIRLKSAWKLMSAISFNHTITYLDLNSNGLGYRAGEILGDAIMENRTLKTLLVNNNSFTSTAAISLCIGIVENMALEHIEINENPIGYVGAKMIMQIAIALGTRVHLSAKNCNTVTVDSNCWYDPSKPYGEFTLDLKEPFHRAIAFHLLQVIASHATYIFEYFTYENGHSKEQLKLVQSIATDREQYLNSEQKQLLSGLKVILNASQNLQLAQELFYEADEDRSGKLDKFELHAVLEKIGFHMDFDHLQDLIMLFDIDGTGCIDLNEFLALLKSQAREALCRIKELTEYPIMALDSAPKKKYIPPKTGKIHCKIIDGFIQKANFYTITSLDSKYASNMARGIGDMSLLSEAVKHNKMRYNEALSMFKTIYKEQRNKAAILLRLLPQMMYSTESIQLISKVTNDNYLELQRIKLTFGVSLKPLLGLYNGYYILDLSKEIHRICLVRLLEQSENFNARRKRESIIKIGKVGDTSQHQNWTCFRNELYNDEKIEITSARFTPMPESGILSFDFSGGNRPSLMGELTITDKRLCKVLNNLCLLKSAEFTEAIHLLHSFKKRCNTRTDDKKLFMPTYEFTAEKALEVGRCMDDFYANVPQREEINKQGMRKEEIKSTVKNHGPSDKPVTAATMNRPGRHGQASTNDGEGGDGAETGDENSVGGASQESSVGEGGGADDDMSSVYSNDTSQENISLAAAEQNLLNPETFAATGGGESFTTEEQAEASDLALELRTESNDDSQSVSIAGGSTNLVNDFPVTLDAVGGGDEAAEELARSLLAEAAEAEEGDETHPATPYTNTHSESGQAKPTEEDEGNFELTSEQLQKIRKKRIREQKKRLHSLWNTVDISLHAKAIRFVEIIDETFNRLWINCRHLALMLYLFQKLFGANLSRTDYFGSYSAEIVIALFARIVDLHNFELILQFLSARDCAAVFCRIGMLNIFNPIKPEVTYELCLSRPEERLIAKMIIYLSVIEPGINITYKRFQWKRELDPTPGWEVTDAWFTESGLADHGYFAFTYYSGEGKNKMGCIPDIPLRKALTQMVLLNENEVIVDIDEDGNVLAGFGSNLSNIHDELILENTGAKHYQQNQDVWLNYLVYNTTLTAGPGHH